MPVPGDRKDGVCRGCHAKIVWIYSANSRWVPCEALPSHVDGQRMLVFANGVVGRSYGTFEGGHEAHFALCPKRDLFRKKAEPKAAEPPAQEAFQFEPK